MNINVVAVFRTQVLGVGSPGYVGALIIINVSIIHRPPSPVLPSLRTWKNIIFNLHSQGVKHVSSVWVGSPPSLIFASILHSSSSYELTFLAKATQICHVVKLSSSWWWDRTDESQFNLISVDKLRLWCQCVSVCLPWECHNTRLYYHNCWAGIYILMIFEVKPTQNYHQQRMGNN